VTGARARRRRRRHPGPRGGARGRRLRRPPLGPPAAARRLREHRQRRSSPPFARSRPRCAASLHGVFLDILVAIDGSSTAPRHCERRPSCARSRPVDRPHRGPRYPPPRGSAPAAWRRGGRSRADGRGPARASANRSTRCPTTSR
jgi:hypothetical protein